MQVALQIIFLLYLYISCFNGQYEFSEWRVGALHVEKQAVVNRYKQRSTECKDVFSLTGNGP